MYIKGLIWKSLMDPTGQSPKIITNLEHLSNDELFTRLQILDPNRAKQLHCNDRRRVLRSLEVTIICFFNEQLNFILQIFSYFIILDIL